jgi:hypothetical protein
MLFGHVLKKHVDSVVRRVNKIKGNSNVRGHMETNKKLYSL